MGVSGGPSCHPASSSNAQAKETPLELGVEMQGTVVEGHMEYYSFLAPADQLALTLTVTPTSGNPNLYVNTGGARWPNSCAARLALACPRAP